VAIEDEELGAQTSLWRVRVSFPWASRIGGQENKKAACLRVTAASRRYLNGGGWSRPLSSCAQAHRASIHTHIPLHSMDGMTVQLSRTRKAKHFDLRPYSRLRLNTGGRRRRDATAPVFTAEQPPARIVRLLTYWAKLILRSRACARARRTQRRRRGRLTSSCVLPPATGEKLDSITTVSPS
jgi:hypothetical protein